MNVNLIGLLFFLFNQPVFQRLLLVRLVCHRSSNSFFLAGGLLMWDYLHAGQIPFLSPNQQCQSIEEMQWFNATDIVMKLSRTGLSVKNFVILLAALIILLLLLFYLYFSYFHCPWVWTAN